MSFCSGTSPIVGPGGMTSLTLRGTKRDEHVAERMIEANGVKLCADAAGNPGNPPVLLVMGMSASMVWWEDEFCARLAEGRHFAIRYDHRDTGRSVTYQV